MSSNKVIDEIYRKYKKPPHDAAVLNLDEFVEQLSPFHNINVRDNEVVISDLDEFNPFRRFLIRSLTAILDLDKQIAFVFKNHILFFNKQSDEMRIHIKQEPEHHSWFQRLFGK